MSVEKVEKKALPIWIPLFKDLFVITDPGRDQDDEDVLVMLNRMIRLEILQVLGVVANLAPSAQRARLAKGTLQLLGQNQVPVGYGSNCLQSEEDGLEYQFSVGYLAEHDNVVDGKALIYETLKNARPKSIVLLLISGLTDAAAVLREHHYLFQKAVRRVVIMGGVKTCKDNPNAPELDGEGRILPDETAQNHKFDLEATRYLYRMLQDMEIPITVVSRHAAVAARVPRSVYEEMAATGHPIGTRLLAAQKEAIQKVWERANMAADDPNRLELPARCDKTWFCNNFLGGKGAELTSQDNIWDLVQTFNLYDPCTLAACIPNQREHFFSPTVVEVHGVEHLIIGVSAQVHNVREPLALAEHLRNMLVESLKQAQVSAPPKAQEATSKVA